MKHEFLSINDIFEKYKNINVPYYQRDYVWGSKNGGRNLYKFIDDIFCQYRDNPESNYFIGTLAFCSSKVNDIIDGQQRITSIVLILTLLANNKCSEEIREYNQNLIMPNDDFIIKEEFYLTEELKNNLGLPNNFNSQGYKVNISETVDRINMQINRAWSDGYTTQWYDGLYNYILNKVMFISLEYSNVPDSLKYFLNINSLSIELTQSDIFYSIFSQILRISDNITNIFNVKQKIQQLAELKGLNRDIEGYKGYDSGDKGVDNIIYIFLNAYYQKDRDLTWLNDTGIGKWMSFYKNDVFTRELKAKKFADDFLQYLRDFEYLVKSITNYGSNINESEDIYTSFILLQFEGYSDLLRVLADIFKERHNYVDNNIYNENANTISNQKLNTICKRLNLTLIKDYVGNAKKKLNGFIENIKINENLQYIKKIEDLVHDIIWDDIFNLRYNDKKMVSNSKISDDSKNIKLVLALEEAYLSYKANPNVAYNKYLNDLLQGDFTIEHILSIEEYKSESRLNAWKNKKNKYNTPEEFDNDRCRFEYLTILDLSTNSTAGTDDISLKLKKYKNAKKVLGSEWEFLPLSFVDNSEFYNNENIQKLGLPERKIQNIDQNTFDLSSNNREFNTQLLKKSVIFLQQMGEEL